MLHYHRRCFVSLLSSAWGQVGPKRYCYQANTVQRSNDKARSAYISFAQGASTLTLRAKSHLINLEF